MSRFKKRVSSKGKVTKKRSCRSGYKAQGGKCVKMSSKERTNRRKALKKAVRKRKASPSSTKRATKKRLKALKKRKSRGL